MPMQYIKDSDAEIVLVAAPSDPRQNHPAYLEDVATFSKTLNATGVNYNQRGMAFDSAEGLGYPLGQYIVEFGPIAVAAISGPITAWLSAKLGRKVRIKFGDTEAEARNVDELMKLLKLVDEQRQKKLKRKRL